MFRKNLLLLSMNFVLQTKKSELTRSKLILTLQNGILSCNSALRIIFKNLLTNGRKCDTRINTKKETRRSTDERKRNHCQSG